MNGIAGSLRASDLPLDERILERRRSSTALERPQRAAHVRCSRSGAPRREVRLDPHPLTRPVGPARKTTTPPTETGVQNILPKLEPASRRAAAAFYEWASGPVAGGDGAGLRSPAVRYPVIAPA